FLNFLTYNNAVPIMMGIVFLGAGGALAATPAVQQSVFSSTETLQSIDNTRIINIDLDSYPLSVQVTAVTEDADNYYVDYTMNTIDIQDDVWQDVAKRATMTVAKAQLKNEDLGLFTSEKLSQIRAQEIDRLKRTQVIEKQNGESQKVVATAYSGLVGKFLSPTEETFPGYTPVVTEPAPSSSSVPVANSIAPSSGTETTVPSVDTSAVTSTTAGDPTDTVPPTIQILGKNPAHVAIGSTYQDLGVVVIDDKSIDIGYTSYLDDNPQATTFTLDMTVPATHTITYVATDQAGNKTIAIRTVIIYDPNQPATLPDIASSTASTTP